MGKVIMAKNISKKWNGASNTERENALKSIKEPQKYLRSPYGKLPARVKVKLLKKYTKKYNKYLD